jgi:hypothetical protein
MESVASNRESAPVFNKFSDGIALIPCAERISVVLISIENRSSGLSNCPIIMALVN